MAIIKNKPPGYWTEERLHNEALKYNNRKDFRAGNASAYQKSHASGNLEKVCSHMIEKNKPAGYWTEERVRKEALLYSTKHEFKEHSNSAYYVSRTSDFHDANCSHMSSVNRPNGYWTKELVQAEAFKYKHRTEFAKFSNGAYSVSVNSDYHDETCEHMVDKLEYWTDETIANEALKYTTRVDFQKYSKSAYQISRRSQNHEIFCSHMIHQHENWTPDKLRNEALKYKTRVAFGKGSASAYASSRVSGNHDEYCAHMKRGRVGFNPDKPAILYYLKIDTRIQTIFKIGVTNLSIKERFLKRERNMITVLEEWSYSNGADAYSCEQFIIKLFSPWRYKGESPFRKLSTREMFTHDIMRLHE